MLTSAVAVVIGWGLIRRHHVRAHRRAMLLAVVCGAGFFVLYVLHTLLLGDTMFAGPRSWRGPYLAFLQAHSLLATVAGILGVVTLRRALRRRFAAHRRLGPWTAGLWLGAAASGLVVFLLLYVIFPAGPSVGLLKALTGH